MATSATVFLLDKSGSMFYRAEDTVGGFNSFLADLKKNKPDSLFSLYMFSDKCECFYDNLKVSDVKNLVTDDYVTQGNTALFDSMGEILLKYGGEVETKFVILTDGFENASRKYTKGAIKDMIKASKMELIYIGADLECANDLGITRTRHFDGEDSPAAFEWASQSI